MAFKPLTEDKESLQALAFAVRQNKGDNITPEDVLAAMDLSVLDYNVKNYCDIDYTKLTSRFENWKNIQVGFIALNKAGQIGAFAIQSGFSYAHHSAGKNQLIKSTSLLSEA